MFGKKLSKIFVACILCAVCFTGALPANANQWGVKGKLYNIFAEDGRWDDYGSGSRQAGDFIVLESRYHSALLYADKSDKLHVYTGAVYQPKSKRSEPNLSIQDNELHISYGEHEEYVFSLDENNSFLQLKEAKIDDFYMYAAPQNGEEYAYSYYAQDKNFSSIYPYKITLADFNIELFPRSVDEVKHINYMQARLDSGKGCLGGLSYDADNKGVLIKTNKKGTAPVYSAPFGEDAWRAAKGKAAVGLAGDIWLLDYYLNDDGDCYACIRYDVSQRTQRIGYALCSDLGLEPITEQDQDSPGNSFTRVEVRAKNDTYITDDPDVSEFRQFEVPEGTQLRCLGLYNDYYACVTAETKGKKFTNGGAITFGFTPVKDLCDMPMTAQTDIMKNLSGCWFYYAGGGFAPDCINFYQDGHYLAKNVEENVFDDVLDKINNKQHIDFEDIPFYNNVIWGNWSIVPHNTFENLYWNKPEYAIILRNGNGGISIYGFSMEDEDHFDLTNWEGGGGYVRMP